MIVNFYTAQQRTRPELADDVDFTAIAECTNGYTGADLAGLVRQSAMLALKESIHNPDSTDLRVRKSHFDLALKLMRPSVSAQVSSLRSTYFLSLQFINYSISGS